MFIGVTHTVIDALPLWLGKYVNPLQRFVLDQMAHTGLVLLALGASGYLGAVRLVDSLVAGLRDYRLLTFALGYAFITMPAWVLVEFVVYGAVRGPAPDFTPAANKFLGILERGLITTFVVLGQFTLVPLVALPRLVFQGRQVVGAQPQRAIPYVAELLVSVTLAVAIGLWLRGF